MSDIALTFGALDVFYLLLVACMPGVITGLLLGGLAWPAHPVWGGAIGAVAGAALIAAYGAICLGSDIALADGFDGAVAMSARIGWPGLLLGGVAAAALRRDQKIIAALIGAPFGFVLWLAGWAALR